MKPIRRNASVVASILVGIGGLSISSAAPTKSPMPKWEYCLVQKPVYTKYGESIVAYLPGGKHLIKKASTGNTQAAVDFLNVLGNDGWEIVHYDGDYNNSLWTLKRRK